MTMNPLPPQAYTKDTLVKAFQWIQLQPDNIKELASTPDVLVSLYLKAKLQGDAALERPSIQNFKSELKNLAGQLGEFDSSMERTFETYEAPTPSANSGMIRRPMSQSAAQTAPSATSANSHATSLVASHVSSQSAFQAHAHQAAAPAAQPSQHASATHATNTRGTSVSDLDAKSLMLVQEIRNQCNLSSDAEALRLMISVGHSQLKNLVR